MKDAHTLALRKATAKGGKLLLLLSLAGTALAAPEPAPQTQLAHTYGQLPLRFEPNQGQTAPEVRFLAHGPGYSLFLTAKEAVLVLQKPVANTKENLSKAKAKAAVLHMTLKGANPKASITGQAPLPGKVNYLRGKDPKQWRTHIPTYARVKYDQIYPGIDLIYYGRQHQLEYDFIIEPGADPKAIHLAFTGAKAMHLDEGQLVLTTLAGEVSLHKPILYQEIEGERQGVKGGYVRQGPQQVGFQIGDYNPAYPLVIDPVLSYATYLGGDWGLDIAVDWRGQAYVTGSAGPTDFPNAGQPYGGGSDAFIAKLNRAGDALLYSTYLGGSGSDEGISIAVDRRGQAYVTGDTTSTDFPIYNAVQRTLADWNAVFVAKLSRKGEALVYSTYLGGSGGEDGTDIAVDWHGQAYVTGFTTSDDFPTTHHALQLAFGGDRDAFVAKFNRTGGRLVYSTYLGGSGSDDDPSIAVDWRGQAYVTGSTYSSDFPTHDALRSTMRGITDAFVAKFNRTGERLVYSTYLGGSGFDAGTGIAVDRHGQAYVVGYTVSTDFPNAGQSYGGRTDAFITKLNRAGNALVYSTYLGGSGYDQGNDIAVDWRGQVYVTGLTLSTDFPTHHALQKTLNGHQDVFVAKLNRAGKALVYSTYLGGGDYETGWGIAVDQRGQAYVTGGTYSSDFPTHNALRSILSGRSDAFVVKISSQRSHPCHPYKTECATAKGNNPGKN